MDPMTDGPIDPELTAERLRGLQASLPPAPVDPVDPEPTPDV